MVASSRPTMQRKPTSTKRDSAKYPITSDHLLTKEIVVAENTERYFTKQQFVIYSSKVFYVVQQ